MRGRRIALVLATTAMGACSIPRWPAPGPLTSAFGLRFLGLRPDIHRGVDLGVPTGTEVRAMSDARVRFAGVQQGYGNVVWLDHGGEVLTVYAHLSAIRVTTASCWASFRPK